MKDKTEKRAEKIHDKLEGFAEAAANVFEVWLKDHPDATYEQKHDYLRQTIMSNSMMALMMMSFSL